MTQPFVVSLKLTGDGRQAVQETRDVRRELEALQKAAANANQTARQAAIGAAVGMDRAGFSGRAADIAAYGEQLDRLRARYNPVFAASQAYNRELDGINQAHRLGAISVQEHAAAIAALNVQYQKAGASADAFKTAAARTNGGAANANALNLGFQAQDIAMMTLMGQAPGMLALQQGMQVGGIFSQMGSGRAVVQGLGSAVTMLLNPLNLATIATIGLGAAGVQWFMSTLNSAEEATDALERHREMLGSLLVGYDQAKSAADAALESALKLPQGVVASDLRATLRDQEAAQEEVQRRIEANRDALAETVGFLRDMQNVGSFGMGAGPDSAGLQQIDMLRQLAIDASSSRAELNGAMLAARELFNTSDDPAIRDLADQAYQLALQLIQVQAQAQSATAALGALSNMDIQIRVQVATDQATAAIEQIAQLAPELRSAREQAEDALSEALGSAPDGILRTAALQEYQRTIAALDEQDRRREAERASRGAGRDFDQWQSANDNFRQRIESQRLELSLLGQSTYEVERQKAAFDLLNQARQAGVQITEPVINQINRMAEEYAATKVQIEQATAAQAALDEQFNFYRGAFRSFVSDIKAGQKEGQTFWEAFGNAGANAFDRIADRALGMAADGIFNMIIGAFMPGFGQTGGAWGNGLWGSAIFNAKGNVFASPALSAYSNQVVDQPTMFAFAKGAGIMGEAGAEAIIPLTRTASGDLGVRMTGDIGSGMSPAGITFAPVNNFYGSSNMSAAEFARLLDERDRRLLDSLPQVITDAQRRARMAA